MELQGDLRLVLQGAVTGLLENSRQSCVEDRRLCGQSRLCASHGPVALYVQQNVFTSGSP